VRVVLLAGSIARPHAVQLVALGAGTVEATVAGRPRPIPPTIKALGP